MPLGRSDATHRHLMKESDKIAKRYVREVKKAAKAGDCWNVWEGLMVVRARVSDYYAHMASLSNATRAESNRHAELADELHSLRQSLGWQCVRKLRR